MLNNNANIAGRAMLTSPGTVCTELPLPPESARMIDAARRSVFDILQGRSDRLMMIVGPCSIHDPDAALRYAGRLKALGDEVRDRFMVIMRVYFEKPRTTLGWKGLIYDPDLNGEYNIEKGIVMARRLLLKIAELGLPAATEMLDPVISAYLEDTITWAAIGARTTEAPTHRQLASGLPMAVGFKNSTDGDFQTAIDAVATARSPHSFIGTMENGHTGIFRTKGNPYCHVVLRGGNSGPNYDAVRVSDLKERLRKANLPERIVIDCSHANSGKDPRKQHIVFRDVIRQCRDGEKAIAGIMLESWFREGSQKLQAGVTPCPELSITDPCIGWEETERLIREAAKKLRTV